MGVELTAYTSLYKQGYGSIGLQFLSTPALSPLRTNDIPPVPLLTLRNKSVPVVVIIKLHILQPHCFCTLRKKARDFQVALLLCLYYISLYKQFQKFTGQYYILQTPQPRPMIFNQGLSNCVTPLWHFWEWLFFSLLGHLIFESGWWARWCEVGRHLKRRSVLHVKDKWESILYRSIESRVRDKLFSVAIWCTNQHCCYTNLTFSAINCYAKFTVVIKSVPLYIKGNDPFQSETSCDTR